MDIPELVQEHLGGEELLTGVKIGEEDVVCITPTRTLLYRAEGLLSDENVTEFPHEVERLRRKAGRRKTTFVFDYVEGQGSLKVPNDVAGDVLDLVMEGVLTVERLLDDDEGVVGAFRFSELTLVVAEKRVVKHVGNTVWEDDYETFAYEDLTGLAFEQASVATEIVMRIGGRPQRIKTPNDKARVVEKTLKKAVFEYFGVTSMDELQSEFGDTTGDEETATTSDSGFALDSDIKPLGDESESSSPFSGSGDEGRAETEADVTADPETTADADPDPETAPIRNVDAGADEQHPGANRQSTADQESTAEPDHDEPDRLRRADLEAVSEQLSELTTAVNKQNELLRRQHEAVEKLVEELRRGR